MTMVLISALMIVAVIVYVDEKGGEGESSEKQIKTKKRGGDKND